MKIYEKPMAIINKFEVEDVIAASYSATAVGENDADLATIQATAGADVKQGVVFEW